MDQIKIGKFIASCRKEQGLTQAALAEKLGITDRAVSKWETGKSCPDASIMLELCGILQINVNELLSGEHIHMEDYKAISEKTILELKTQNEQYSRMLLNLEIVLGTTATVVYLIMLLTGLAALTGEPAGVSMPAWLAIGMIAAGSVIFLVGVWCCLVIERKAGYYQCSNCGGKYVPTMTQVVIAVHKNRTRLMKCPHCGKRCWAYKTVGSEIENTEGQ